MSINAIVHHARVLERTGLVKVHRVGGGTAVFPANAGFRGKEAATVLLRRDTPSRIHGLRLQRTELDQRALADALGLRHQTVSKNFLAMVKAGLVRVEEDGARRYHAIVATKGPPAVAPTIIVDA